MMIVETFVALLSVNAVAESLGYTRNQVLDKLLVAFDSGELEATYEGWVDGDNVSVTREACSIYTDGSTPNNQCEADIGGIGVVVFDCNGSAIETMSETIKATHEHKVTNQRCELMAFIKALEVAQSGDSIYSDSTYVCDGWNKWFTGWERRGWRKADKKPVANVDLWLQVRAYRDLIGHIEVHWVKGHSGVEGNELADKLATEAAGGL